jgi:hypothetical protein
MNSKPLSKALRRLKDCSLLHLRHMQAQAQAQSHLALALLVSFAITTTTQSVRAETTPYVEGQVIAQFKEPLPHKINPLSGEKEAYTLMADYPSLQFQFIHPIRTQVVLISGDSVENLIALFQDHPDIVFVEPNYKQSLQSIERSRSQIPNDALYSLQWALESSNTQGDGLDVDFVDAWELSRDLDPNQPILIAVIDSNIAINHPDLKNQLWVNSQEIPDNGIDDDNNGYIDDIHGYNFGLLTNDPSGPSNHGSHVAGISVAESNNQEGISGIMPKAKLIALACAQADGFFSTAETYQAKEYVLDLVQRGENVVVINASYGSTFFSRLEYQAIQELDQAGVVFCAAAGNASQNLELEIDFDSDGRLDNGEDRNGNGILDSWEDLDNDGILDTSEDLDGDGHFDTINEDQNTNDILDSGEDLDGDGRLDLGVEDIDNDGHFDDRNEDRNGDGILDDTYPATYNSFPSDYELPNIISVASTNDQGDLSSFSNYGVTVVDLAAPGSRIASTLSGNFGNTHKLSLSDGNEYSLSEIQFSGTLPEAGLSGSVINCSIGNPEDFPGAVDGQIALIQRGGGDPPLLFSEKVENAMAAGAIVAIVYNNIEEDAMASNWTLGDPRDPPWIPSYRITLAEGTEILQSLPLTGTVNAMEEEEDFTDRYGYNSGTSMASPMVAGAVAFAALNFPNDTVQERKNRILNAVIPLDSLSDKVRTGGTLNLLNIVDSDSDKLPDWWEFERFSTLVNTPSQDSDSDGYTNQEEYLAQTDPIDASSILSDSDYSKVSDLSLSGSDSLSFTFITYPGYSYTLETLNSLEDNWLNALSPIDGDGTEQRITVDQLGAQDHQFYRIKASR